MFRNFKKPEFSKETWKKIRTFLPAIMIFFGIIVISRTSAAPWALLAIMVFGMFITAYRDEYFDTENSSPEKKKLFKALFKVLDVLKWVAIIPVISLLALVLFVILLNIFGK